MLLRAKGSDRPYPSHIYIEKASEKVQYVPQAANEEILLSQCSDIVKPHEISLALIDFNDA